MTKFRQTLGLILLASIAWCDTAAFGATNMPDPINSMCVGRFNIDLPGDARASIDSTYHYIGARSPEAAVNFDEIKKELEVRKEKYAITQMKRNDRSDAIYRSGGLDPNKLYGKTQLVGFQTEESEKLAVLSYHPKLDSPQTTTEVHRFIDGLQYVFKSEDAGADAYPNTHNAMLSATMHFQPLPGRTQPSGYGFCIAGGMFADDGRPPVHESFTLVARFKDHPDAQFTIDANAIDSPDKDEPSLKFRVDSELGILRQSVQGHVAVLVRGEHEAAGQKGYQIGLSVPNDAVAGTTAYKFFWAADGVPNDVTRPYMEVQLTIQPDADRLATITTADAAKAMWEELLQGIQIRPGAARH
jgi:hypothetical protein